jgi:hypothetical protein
MREPRTRAHRRIALASGFEVLHRGIDPAKSDREDPQIAPFDGGGGRLP